MRFHDKHLIATMDKGAFYLNFRHFMELEGKGDMTEIAEEFGISGEEVKHMKKKMSRA